ncbi:MAG: pilus assembly protein [Phycisphaerales bacterium]|nr:pilus assembly protein [Phycisphaerales bacterium]
MWSSVLSGVATARVARRPGGESASAELMRGVKCAGRKRGAALVEFAVVLPLLLVLLFGIIEFGWVFMVRQSLSSAAREGCRMAVLKTATQAMVQERVREVMAPTGFAEGTSWNMDLSAIDDALQTVTVTIPINDVALTGGFILHGGYDLSGTCSMRKEGTTVEDEE